MVLASNNMPVGPTDDDHRWSCDILIVGAGPAGTAAAIEATRRGCSVVVVDKARFPRDKCCGDGLTAAALRRLERLGLDRSTVPSWIDVDEVVVRSPSGRTVSLPLPAGRGAYAAVCRRRELDSALVDLARSSGATVLEGYELEDVTQSADGVEALVNGITFQANYLIAADGMWSPTRKLLGLGRREYRGEWHAFRQYFGDVSERAASELMVWFEPDLLPGYAWSFPLGDGSANVGFGIQRGHRFSTQDMKTLWPALLEREHVADFLGPSAKPEAPHRAWPIPANLGDGPLTVGRVLFVGDAATATDPMTGEGIGQALETGTDAVVAITAAGTSDPAAASDLYRRRLERGMVRDHGLARGLSALLARQQLAELALSVIGASDWSRRNFARWLFEDYPRAVLVTPRRWSRKIFAKPGAFDS